MQGQRSSVSALPENLSFEHGSMSSDSGIDSQMSWNRMQTSVQSLLPDYRISSSDPNISYLHHARHEVQNGEWSVGQASSGAAQNQGDQNDGKTEHTLSIRSRASLTLEEHQYEPSNAFSSDIADVNPNGNHATTGSFLLHNPSSNPLPQDLNIRSCHRDHQSDDCRVVERERPNTYMSIGSSNTQMMSTGSSSNSIGVLSGCGGYVMDESERRGSSLDGQRLSCKRKAFEVVGQSSGAGSSNCYQSAERSQRHVILATQIAASNNSMSRQIDNNLVINNGLEQSNSRLRIGIGEAVSANPSLTASVTTAERSRRNLRLRGNGSPQQDPMPGNPFSMEADFGNVDVSSSRPTSRLVLRNRQLDLNPAPGAENGSVHGQSVLLHIPFVRRNLQSRWNGASTSRTSWSPGSAISGERDAALYVEPTQRNIPRNVLEHPVFVPANERRSSSPHTTNWNFAGGSNNIAGNVPSSSQTGTSSGVNSSAPTWPHRICPLYPRRLSDIVRRSMLSSAGTEAGGQSSNLTVQSISSTTPQEMALTSGSGNPGHHISNSRSALLERHLDGAFGLPNSLRNLASAGEGRTIMSEHIRHVLDLMRRGEGLRLEDVMILDQSIFFGMADIHDRHRDLRLDVDNMSYEELLALEERIGNVCTGLNEETITNRLKNRKYVHSRTENPAETEPCSICREEYKDGEDLGTLECGHDFHDDCIKQWLMLKNLCPICKTTGLKT